MWLAPARLQCTMANDCNWTCVLTFIVFVFDSSLIKRSLLTRTTGLSSLFQSSHMHSVYESQAQSWGSSPMRAGDFICPFVIVLLFSLFPSVARDLCGCYRTTQSSRGKPEMQPLSGMKLPAVWALPMMQCRGPKETPFFSLSRSILIRSQCSTFFHMTVITVISSILKPSKLPTHTAFLSSHIFCQKDGS